MSGPQTFHQKVTIPLVVILATVGGLFLVGTQLMGLNSTPVAEEPVAEVVEETPVAKVVEEAPAAEVVEEAPATESTEEANTATEEEKTEE